MKKILIIEDNPSTRQIYRDFFMQFKYIDLLEETDGDAGFKTARNKKPDLIILDNRMPKLSGEEVAKKLKADPITSNIPVIMITSMDLDKRQIDLIKLDVDQFIQHPLSPWELKSAMEKQIGPLQEEDK